MNDAFNALWKAAWQARINQSNDKLNADSLEIKFVCVQPNVLRC